MCPKWHSYHGKTLDIMNFTEEDILLTVVPPPLSKPRASCQKGAAQSEYKAGAFYQHHQSKWIARLSPSSTWIGQEYSALLRKGTLYLSRPNSFDGCMLDLGRIHRPESWRGQRGWEGLDVTVKVGQKVPFRLYRFKVNRSHHRLVILPHRELANFLANVPSSTPLSDLLLPGTHDTLAFYGYPVSQCQSPTTPLEVQLQSGIRVFDLRFSIIDGVLIAYHGASPQFTPYLKVLRILAEFLRSDLGRSETVICSIKQEDGAQGRFQLFSHLVHAGIDNPEIRDTWFLENRVPMLGEVRGKAILLSRFGDNGEEWDGGAEGMGIHPYTWPNSVKDGFSWILKDTLVRTQDWYAIPTFLSIPEKFERAVRLLEPPSKEDLDRSSLPPVPFLPKLRRQRTASSASTSPETKYGLDPEKPAPERSHMLSITFFSAATFPLALPQTVALGFGWPQWNMGVEGVNVRLGRWLLDKVAGDAVCPITPSTLNGSHFWQPNPERLSGWTLLDFYEWPLLEAGIVPLLVELNFIRRKQTSQGCAVP